jgi:hypothetical protein
MDLVEAKAGFERATKHCDNLITVHRGHGGPGAGRRAEEVSLNRAVIVLTVASWQSAVQDMTEAALDLSAPGGGSPLSAQSYNVVAGRVRAEIGAFSTPNAQNTRKLMIAAGFDPRPLWTWQQRGGRGIGMITKTPHDADVRIDEWLKVRHAIAQGHASMPQVAALGAVRQATGAPPVDPPIRLADAEQCLSFFRRLTSLTLAGLAHHLGVPMP